jgi:hypothetical protein
MADIPENTSVPNSELSEAKASELIQQLRRKQGTWVEWGQACQALQKAGFSPQTLFEETGFEPVQQNQVVVGAQVYGSMLTVGVPDAVKAYFEGRGSDVLYELRILNQVERAAAAQLAFEKGLDMDEAREVAKAVKDFSRLGTIPDHFTDHPGDAIAYQMRKLAREKSDLQERSRLIAKGLRFAHSEGARRQVEQLLTDFTVTRAKPAPRMPLYRLEEDDEVTRIVAVVGRFPLTKDDVQAVPFVEAIDPFGMVQFTGTGAWVPIPGWQVIRRAEDPIAILCPSDQLPAPIAGNPEDVLVIIDRSQRTWDENSYFLTTKTDPQPSDPEQSAPLQLQWFPEEPEIQILGRMILVMRPKKVLDEDYTKEPWQIDE